MTSVQSEHKQSTAPTLDIERLSVRRGSTLVLDVLSVCAQPGRVLAVIGPNGAGKSTMLKAVLGLVPVTTGSVRWAGHELLSLPERQRARLVAYVPQRTQLMMGLRVSSVVAMGRYAHRNGLARLSQDDQRLINDALEQVDASALTDRRFDQLSCGEMQRVLMARALVTQAPVMILDEPTAALDIGHALTTLALIRRLAASGRTLVLALHDLQHVVDVADDVLLLHHGRVIAQGLTREVIAPGPIADAFGVSMIPGAAMAFHLF